MASHYKKRTKFQPIQRDVSPAGSLGSNRLLPQLHWDRYSFQVEIYNLNQETTHSLSNWY